MSMTGEDSLLIQFVFADSTKKVTSDSLWLVNFARGKSILYFTFCMYLYSKLNYCLFFFNSILQLLGEIFFFKITLLHLSVEHI